MILPFIFKYWKLIVAGLLAGLLATQTIRLGHAKLTIERQKVDKAQFEAEIAAKRAEGVAEGAKQQREAQALIDAKRSAIEAATLRDAQRRVREAESRAARLAERLAGEQWQCLREPLSEEVLNEYRQ